MKKIISILIIFGLFAASLTARADEIDATTHLKYTVSSGEVTVTGFDPDFTPPADYALVIPDEIAGMPVVAIGDQAFLDQTTIASIAIPSSVTTIGNYAFKQCTALEEVTIPSSVTYFGTDVFNGCTGMVTANIDCPTIPVSFLNGKTSLQTVVIGPHVGTIGATAFRNCTGLSSVSIADGVTIIGNSAFNGCTALTSIAIPSTVTTMGTYIFQGCSQLATATFGSGINITSIPAGLFMECTVLGNVTIPSGVTSIGQDAFRKCYGFTSISVPSGVTSIGGYAFDNCSNATSVSLPTGLTTIGEFAFRNDYKLTSFTIPSTVTTIGNYVFSYCSGLTSIEIPNSVTSLGTYVFNNCTNLQSVTFAAGCQITTLQDRMFRLCENLTSFEVPASVKTLGAGAFRESSLATVTFEAGSQLTTIGDNAFYPLENLTTITIPRTVKTLGAEAFRGCSSLASVIFESGSQLTTISEKAFMLCSSLTSFTFPSTVKTIGDKAFQECTSLASVTFEAGCSPTRLSAFSACTSLDNVTIPSSVTSIGRFDGCTSLTSIVIPASVTSIDANCFNGCTSLVSATFADGINLTTIPETCFKDCTAMENVNIPATVTVIDKEAFRNCTKLPPVSLPSGLTTIGELAFFNDKFNSLTIPESVTSIGKEAFAWCTNISSVEISENVVSMGTYVFNHCTNLSSVNFAAPTMPNYAFQECANLTNVTIAPTVTTIGTNIFRKCTSLKELVIPRSVQSIGYAIIAECTSFETLDLSACSDIWDLYKGSFNASYEYESSLGLTGVIILLPPGSNATGTDIYLAPQPNLSQDGDGYYLIGSPEEYTAFAALVRSTPSANARITADIVLTGDEPTIGIGPDENNKIAYSGTFDGQGHSISINFTNDNRIQHNYGGLFTWTTDATIRNLWVKGLMETTKPSAGGFVGGVKGTLAIERCISSVAITGVVETLTEMYLGGFIGQTHSATITANDCLTTVTINGGTNVKYVAGITGRVANSSTFEIHRCLSMTNLSDATSPAAFAWKWTGSTSIGTHNLYWSDGSDGDLDAAASDYQTAVSHTQLADGTIATFLQAGRAETIWVQDAVSNLPALKLFANAVTTVLSSAAPATVMGEDKYVTTFFDGTKSYRLAPGALAYTAGRNGTDIIFYRIGEDSNVIPQGTAVIIVADSSYIELIELESTSVTARAGNILAGSDTDIDTPAGTVYVLGVTGETPGFYVFSGATIPAGKAYYVAE